MADDDDDTSVNRARGLQSGPPKPAPLTGLAGGRAGSDSPLPGLRQNVRDSGETTKERDAARKARIATASKARDDRLTERVVARFKADPLNAALLKYMDATFVDRTEAKALGARSDLPEVPAGGGSGAVLTMVCGMPMWQHPIDPHTVLPDPGEQYQVLVSEGGMWAAGWVQAH